MDIIAAFAAAAVISLFFLVVVRMRRATQPAMPLPGSPGGGPSGSGPPAGTLPGRESPAAASAGPESPAVVDLLVNGWTVTGAAAAATFVDLAERGHLEWDSETVRPVGHGDGLRAHERLIFDRVAAVQDPAVGAAPLGRIPFRDDDQVAAWGGRFRSEVITAAREAGLSQPRFGPRELITIRVGAALTGALTAVILWPVSGFLALFALLVGIPALLAVAMPQGERDTPAGMAAAARWLAVPDERCGPGHAVALGRRRAPVSFDMADRELLWSSHGGRWHRVRVVYPPDRFPYGYGTGALLVRTLTAVVVGGVVFRILHGAFDLSPDGSLPIVLVAIGIDLLCVAGGLAVLAGAGLAVRALLDASSARSVTGQVIWIGSWRVDRRDTDQVGPHPTVLHYLVIDDAGGEPVTAWGLPDSMASGVAIGQTVTVSVRGWTRRVVEIRPADPAQTRPGSAIKRD